jgi:hypothetical protein
LVKRVLLVEPDQDIQTSITNALSGGATLTIVGDFRSARATLQTAPPDLIFTNLRLQAYNGIHLAVLANGTHTRCVVYAEGDDVVLAREVQAVGAFYERLDRLGFVLASYLRVTLPARDLRNPGVQDRRQSFRGGRRAVDVPDVLANVVWSDRSPSVHD